MSETEPTVRFSNKAWRHLTKGASYYGRTVGEVIKFGVTLALMAYEENRAGNTLTVIDQQGERLKDIVIQ